jgi:hypothetical protein
MHNTHKSVGFWFRVLIRVFERMLPNLVGVLIVDMLHAGMVALAWNFVMPHAFGSNTISILHAYALMWLVHVVFWFTPGPTSSHKKQE